MADDTIGWLFVAAQVALLVAIVATPGAEMWDRPIWLVTVAGVLIVVGIVVAAIAALGLGAALTASPVPSADGQLQTTGLYGLVRHPVYMGLILALIGAALRSGNIVTVALVIVTIGFFAVKARWEERRLSERYPDYPTYASTTPRFMPNPARMIRPRSLTP
jgi:protein-S-isoprenylcysteine O-methyltransferase Ste14